MARITWFTQPQTNRNDLRFASFYMYDTVNKDFVRIRLELNRIAGHGDNGATKIICRKNRIVLFADDNNNYNIINVHNIPQINDSIHDFSIGSWHFHHGNIVNNNPYLPNGITEHDLQELATIYIGNNATEDITENVATEAQLSNAIHNLLLGNQ